MIGIRFAYRFILILKRIIKSKDAENKRVMVIGAGEAGKTYSSKIYLEEIKSRWK